MATKRSKNAEHERLDDKSIEKAIEILNNKGTKKAACEVLNISYNTTRLNTLIEKYLENKRRTAEKRKEKRGKPATTSEIQYTVESYLEGRAVQDIAEALYRGPAFVVSILSRYSVPMRNIPHSYFSPKLIPDEACRDKFLVGEKVYSARYDSLATIESEFKPGIYKIYLLSEKQKQYAYQEAAELASLEHLRKLGINV